MEQDKWMTKEAFAESLGMGIRTFQRRLQEVNMILDRELISPDEQKECIRRFEERKKIKREMKEREKLERQKISKAGETPPQIAEK